MSIAERLITVAENVPKVYEAGQKAEYNRLWDTLVPTSDGNMAFRFCGDWTKGTLRPNKDLRPRNAQGMFYEFNSYDITDLEQHFADIGVVLDFSNNASFSSTFASIRCPLKIGVIDASSATKIAYLLNNSTGVTGIKKLILPEKYGSNPFNNAFNYAKGLKDIEMEGTIPVSINFLDCPLTPNSMKSIIGCLKNQINETMAFMVSVLFSNACWAALEADSTAPDGGTWQDYVTSLGWLF